MFPAQTYSQRRNELKKLVGNGIIFLPGNNETPMNYAANTYKFRQDSTFLYYFGLDFDNLAGVIDLDNDIEIIYGNDREIDDVIWMGPMSSMNELAVNVGVQSTKPFNQLSDYLKAEKSKGRQIHFLPQYRHDLIISISQWLEIPVKEINDNKSLDLVRAVIQQRSIKSEEEIEQIEQAVAISYEMNTLAMRHSKPGIKEREVFGAIDGLASGMGQGVSFPTIFSIHGETLHNHHHENIMQDGQLLVLDSGAESELHYASDITRTFPVNRRFTPKQKDIYQIVLAANLRSIEKMKPGITYREVHKLAAKIIFDGLKNLGLTKGDNDEAINNGAHALFFPHGLGHMLGLDVHDMENLGENYVGYDEETKRSEQFGLAYLRFGKVMKPGHVLTVEPGIYFIPALINLWEKDNKHKEYIIYERVKDYLDFGGIRIEDDVLITNENSRILGKPIPKTIDEVEEVCNS